ncbi:MAG: hypothetical protein H6828_12820 [Planctomycetes bacterium]|nr:hypothetical protein [Planctomycetota bacterium]
MPPIDPTTLSWTAGWALVLAGFASGACVGLGFLREGFLGGYTSPRRRLVRLGHVALVALGMLNLAYAAAPALGLAPRWPAAGAWGLVLGGVLMPLVCFLTAWRPACRHLFAVPVLSLGLGALSALLCLPS